MVRTKDQAGGCRKAVAAKAPRKVLAASSTSHSSSSVDIGSPAGKYAGGNPYCPRPTPSWQKGIDNFMKKPPKSTGKENDSDNDVTKMTEDTPNKSAESPEKGSSSKSVDMVAITNSPIRRPVIESDDDE